mmetsp:Transcript_50857/g.51267  ORF Transcript_50857/g.51267 Transcript_50857/m.51267 type:complete len:86 (+) Transcript_50857:381-638(+)
MLVDAGFINISIRVKEESRDIIDKWMPGSGAEDYVLSAVIQAQKPGGTSSEPAVASKINEGVKQPIEVAPTGKVEAADDCCPPGK